MSAPINEKRAANARMVLDHYQEIAEGDDDQQTALADLLSDLMHLARIEGKEALCFEDALTTATINFEAESKRRRSR